MSINILQHMVQIYLPAEGRIGLASIITLTIFALKHEIWHKVNNYDLTETAILDRLCYVLAFSIWCFRVERFGGVANIANVPLEHDHKKHTSRHYRDAGVHETMLTCVSGIFSAYRNSASFNEMYTKIAEFILTQDLPKWHKRKPK